MEQNANVNVTFADDTSMQMDNDDSEVSKKKKVGEQAVGDGGEDITTDYLTNVQKSSNDEGLGQSAHIGEVKSNSVNLRDF